MAFVSVRVCTRYAPHKHKGTRRARQWCARSIIPYYTIRFRAGRTCNSRLSTSFVERRAKSVCLHRLAAAMHSALVSAIVSSTVCWLHLNCEWFTDNVSTARFFAAKTFCELVNFWGRNFTCDLIIAKSNCVYFYDSVPFVVTKWTFGVILFSQI